jgi:hypothetical protein
LLLLLWLAAWLLWTSGRLLRLCCMLPWRLLLPCVHDHCCILPPAVDSLQQGRQ